MLFRPAHILISTVWLLIITSCASGKLHLKEYPPEVYNIGNAPDFTLYALGDAGALNDQSTAVVKALASITEDDEHPGAVIYLGDNVYPSGLAPETNVAEHLHGQQILLNQVTPLKDFDGDIIFMPGNHDWYEMKPGGLDAIKRQGNVIKGWQDSRIKMIPADGCGDPHAIALTPATTMIIFDSQWWIQDWENEPDMNKGCTISSREEFMTSFRQLVEENKDKQLIIAMHHPVYSQGTHGGHFPLRDHLFPLTRVVKWLYIPLPVIGSIYPGYRTLFGHTQDTKHRNYRSLNKQILASVEGLDNVVFLSGHDHNMQYTRRDGNHHLISGAASKLNRISNSRYLEYGHMVPGFMKLDVFDREGIRLTIYELQGGIGALNVVFSRFIVKNE